MRAGSGAPEDCAAHGDNGRENEVLEWSFDGLTAVGNVELWVRPGSGLKVPRREGEDMRG